MAYRLDLDAIRARIAWLEENRDLIACVIGHNTCDCADDVEAVREGRPCADKLIAALRDKAVSGFADPTEASFSVEVGEPKKLEEYTDDELRQLYGHFGGVIKLARHIGVRHTRLSERLRAAKVKLKKRGQPARKCPFRARTLHRIVEEGGIAAVAREGKTSWAIARRWVIDALGEETLKNGNLHP